MDAAGPTTGAALSSYQFVERPLDVISSRFRFFGGDSPADPLIARKRRNILPCR